MHCPLLQAAVFEVYPTGAELRPPAQGERSDLATLMELVTHGLEDCPRPANIKELLVSHRYAPYRDSAGRHERLCARLFGMRDPVARQILPGEPRAWQQQVLDLVATEPNDRHIYWYYDPAGAAGKSMLTRHLVINEGAIVLSGRSQDMYYAYGGQRIIIVDVPRADSLEYLNYGAIEKLKDGCFTITKYESRQYVRDHHAHVLIFSNQMPDVTNFTADRLQLIHLSEPA